MKPKREFSKTIIILAWCVLALTIIVNAALLWFNREPMNEALVALVTGVTGGCNIGYFAQNAVRACSLNKNRLRVRDGQAEDIGSGEL